MKILFNTLLCIGIIKSTLFANEIDKSVKVIEKSNNQLKSYQNQIDKNEEVRENLVNEYKYVTATLKNTKKYNEQLSKIVNSQKEELESLDKQIIDIEETQKNIFPLMIDMIKSLKTLVNSDIPFLMEERLQRVQKLEDSLDRADIQTHEKYRIILEAFKIEYDYSKSIETYQDKIEDKTFNILRLGRVALYYQTLDLKEYGYYNKETKNWDRITDSTSKSNIRKAIKIANKQQNVDLLKLPFLAKKETK